MKTFYLGTHVTSWLRRLDLPLFVSRRQLCKLRTLPKAISNWALDSGGFSELSLYGKWTIEPAQYIQEVYRFSDEVGKLDFAAAQDWMCEPFILEKTGLKVEDHQLRTTLNYLTLKDKAKDLPWLPVIQGWERDDYLRHVEMYQNYGVDLRVFPRVGIGSVCRRQSTGPVEPLMRDLSSYGIKLHGFGIKTKGLKTLAQYLESSDSMAWSFAARRSPPLEGCLTHKNCANCILYAQGYYARIIKSLGFGGSIGTVAA